MWYPNRDNKESKIPDRDKKTKVGESSLDLEERKKESKERVF